MKNRLFTVLLIGLITFSCLNMALAKVACPTCNGVGTIACPTCNGTGEVAAAAGSTCQDCLGTGVLTPTIQLSTLEASRHDGATYVTATFINQEIVSVDGTVTATVEGYTGTSDVTTFPPKQEVTVTVPVNYVGSSTRIQMIQTTHATATATQNIPCPYCQGTGTVSPMKTCSACLGTGIVKCTDCGGTGYVEAGFIAGGGNQNGANIALIAGVAGVAVVAVALGFFMVKKRRISEKALRRYSSREFQEWVLKRLDGKAPTSMDTSKGIDGFTRLGHPLLIKQSDDIGMNAIDLFASTLAKNKARNGVIVAFDFSDDAFRGKLRARRNYNLDIQTLTVRELIENRNPL